MIDLSDTAAIADYGRDALGSDVLDAIAAHLAASPADDLVAALDALDRAMLASDPARAKRRAGFFGRMLGTDIEAQALGAQLQERMGVLLGEAQAQATRLAAFADTLGTFATQLEVSIAAIETRMEEGERWLSARPPVVDAASPEARFGRRLSHLATVAASHRITREHLRLTQAQCRQLLDRHAGLRDVLRPVWQQHRIATRGD